MDNLSTEYEDLIKQAVEKAQDAMGNAIKTFDKSNVNRGGDPENAGRFSDKPGSGSSDKDESSKTSSKQEKKPDSGTVQGSGNSSNKPQSGNLGADKPKESNPTMTSSSESFEKRATSLKGKHDKSHDAERQKLHDDMVATGLGKPQAKNLKDLIAELGPDAGFTYDVRNSKTITSGFAVSINPEREMRINLREMDDRQIDDMLEQFEQDNATAFAEDDNHYGGWVDPEDGALVLDISKVLPSIEEARKLGYAANQAGIYDFQVGETIILDSKASVERQK